MKSRFFKICVLVLSAVVLCLLTMSGTREAVYAADEQGSVVLIPFPRESDQSWFSGNWGHEELRFANGWFSDSTGRTAMFSVNERSGRICYCIEPGALICDGALLDRQDETYWARFFPAPAPGVSSETVQKLLGRVLEYGYTGNISDRWNSQNEGDAEKMAKAIATQVLVWETVLGERDEDFRHVSPEGCDEALQTVSPEHPLYEKILEEYQNISAAVQEHGLLPSFCTETGESRAELSWNGARYTAALEDANRVLSRYTFTFRNENSEEVALKYSIGGAEGEELILSMDSLPEGRITLLAQKKDSRRQALKVWGDGEAYPGSPGTQDLVAALGEVDDPVEGALTLHADSGALRIQKTAETGKIEGIVFHVSGGAPGEETERTAVTDASGLALINGLAPGIYMVTEEPDAACEPCGSRRITVNAGQTAELSVENTLKKGSLRVALTCEDGRNEGARFRLRGTSLGGEQVDLEAVTDSSGIAVFGEVPIGSDYRLEQVDPPVRYAAPPAQTVEITWNTQAEREWYDPLKKFAVTLTLRDSEQPETGPQGDARLEGAVWALCRGEETVAVYTTDASGSFTTEYFICGENWSLRELSPGEGYLPNDTPLPLAAEAERYREEYNSLPPLTVPVQVKKGKIVIRYEGDTPDRAADGAEFAVWLESAGAFESSQPTERDTLLWQEMPRDETVWLPYGEYRVRQTRFSRSTEHLKECLVFLREDGQIVELPVTGKSGSSPPPPDDETSSSGGEGGKETGTETETEPEGSEPQELTPPKTGDRALRELLFTLGILCVGSLVCLIAVLCFEFSGRKGGKKKEEKNPKGN